MSVFSGHVCFLVSWHFSPLLYGVLEWMIPENQMLDRWMLFEVKSNCCWCSPESRAFFTSWKQFDGNIIRWSYISFFSQMLLRIRWRHTLGRDMSFPNTSHELGITCYPSIYHLFFNSLSNYNQFQYVVTPKMTLERTGDIRQIHASTSPV
jgi:hypothetical protein